MPNVIRGSTCGFMTGVEAPSLVRKRF